MTERNNVEVILGKFHVKYFTVKKISNTHRKRIRPWTIFCNGTDALRFIIQRMNSTIRRTKKIVNFISREKKLRKNYAKTVMQKFLRNRSIWDYKCSFCTSKLQSDDPCVLSFDLHYAVVFKSKYNCIKGNVLNV